MKSFYRSAARTTETRSDSPESIVTQGFPVIHEKSAARNPIGPCGGHVLEVAIYALPSSALNPLLKVRAALSENVMNTETADHIDDEDWGGYWGRCPTCHEPGKILDVGRVHRGVCHDHKVWWPVGENLFSAWRDQTADERDRNLAFLDSCRRVKPYYLPPETAAALNAATKAKNPPAHDGDVDDEPWEF